MEYIRNALAELKAILDVNGISFNDLDCANIYVNTWNMERQFVFDSKKDSVNVLTDFLKEIDYKPGFGRQELYGEILTNRNSWIERGEYDGSEWWEYKTIPTKEDVLSAKYKDIYNI